MKKILVLFVLFYSCYGSNEDKLSIDKIWTEFYSSSSSSEKVNLLSAEYKLEYMEQINAALYADKKSILENSFEDILNIMMKRVKIDSLDLRPLDVNEFEKAFSNIEETNSILVNTENGLSEIIFESNEEAYGVFNLLIMDKSNHFIKELDGWKINPYKEHSKFSSARNQLKLKYLNRYGSEEVAVEELLKLTLGRPDWSPPFEK